MSSSCECGCGRPPRGSSKWHSDACRKRAARQAKRQALLDDLDAPPAGTVAESIGRLVAKREPAEGTIGHALGRLAERQAALVDEDPSAASALRMTLQALDDADPDDDGGADLWTIEEVIDAVTREGVDRSTRLGRALLAYRPDPDDPRADNFELTTSRPSPQYPDGWRGTMLDGDPADYAANTDAGWPDMGALDFWPLATCPRCGHTERTEDVDDA
jgi:hypothetical protein